MSLAEIKEQVTTLSKTEIKELSAYLLMLQRKDDKEWQAKIQSRLTEMDDGNGIPQAEVERLLPLSKPQNTN